MGTFMDAGGVQRLEEYFRRIGDILGEESRRSSFAVYAMGLLGDGERKSVEPIAARACPDPCKTDAMHQRLLHFAVDSRWSDREVRREAARYALSAMTRREPVEAWIVDDTGFLKQGKHSVGVQRQYTGSAGKITNCQIGVSLSIATRTEHVPIDFELYLPESWTNDSARRQEARIPEDVTFKTKPQLAVQMIGRAVGGRRSQRSRPGGLRVWNLQRVPRTGTLLGAALCGGGGAADDYFPPRQRGAPSRRGGERQRAGLEHPRARGLSTLHLAQRLP